MNASCACVLRKLKPTEAITQCQVSARKLLDIINLRTKLMRPNLKILQTPNPLTRSTIYTVLRFNLLYRRYKLIMQANL